jgi:Rrf2 family protein
VVRSVRGPKGGFTLGRPAAELTLLEVYEAIEGTLNSRNCLLGHAVCTGDCILGRLLEGLDDHVRDYLAGTRISDLAHVFRRRHEIAETDHRDR